MDNPGVPYDLWICGTCQSGNLIESAPNECPVCSHLRDYGIACCMNPGEPSWSSGAFGGGSRSRSLDQHATYENSEQSQEYEESSGHDVAQNASNVYRAPECLSPASPLEDTSRESDPTQTHRPNAEGPTDEGNRMVEEGSKIRYGRNWAHGILIVCGWGEPLIQPGFTRLTWKCRCGHTIYGDVIEYCEGGIAKTVARVRASTGSDVVVTPSGQRPSTRTRAAPMTDLFQKVRRKLSATWQRITTQPPGLPRHTSPGSTSTCAPSGATHSQQPGLLLMSCMKRDKYFRQLYQDDINGMCSDQALFCFLQRQIQRRQGRIRSLFSSEYIRGIDFVKFRLKASGYTEVRPHKPCSTADLRKTCECIPPESKVEPNPGAEYRCKPAGPPEHCPPILSEELMHMLTSPKCIDPRETFVLEQLPKRTKGGLKGEIGQPAEGWGIHFQEGWDFDLLIGLILAVSLFTSLLFAVLWSYFKLDVQGGFGVSSYMVTATGIFVAWFANRAGKMR